jgi:alkanesulfonate monooxygenase SsuD/methylene tetrahydromethanopterin reductase-like flavin-dependent oxidoreductase (luciferase family)
VAVCDDADAGRERAAKLFEAYLNIPTYQRILARGGEGNTPIDVAIVGTEAEVTARLRSYADAGATDLCATALGLDEDRDASQRRTIELLASLVPELETT